MTEKISDVTYGPIYGDFYEKSKSRFIVYLIVVFIIKLYLPNYHSFLNFRMRNFLTTTKYLLLSFSLVSSVTSCLNTRKVAYFNDLKDSALIASKDGLEPMIQKKDILSISVSSLSKDAAAIFNAPNLPSLTAANNSSQTAGYLVSQEGTIKFPIVGDVPAAGLTQKQLEDTLTKILIDKKLLFDPIVTTRFLNFRVTVLGEVNRPGIVYAPSEQISILEALGQAGDLTIYGHRDNVMLVRQEGPDKLVKRLDLNSSKLLQSPYFYLKSNDVLYVEPVKAKIASTNQIRQILPYIFSGISLIVVILTNLLK